MLFSCLLLRLWVNFNIFPLYDHDTKIFIVGMFYGIFLHMLHNCIFVDFFELIEGMNDCQITNKASLLSCVSSCFSGYVYFTTTPYTFWTATISFLLTEGMECCFMLQFVSADALFFFPQQSQLPTTSMHFGLIWSNDNLWNCMSLLIHLCHYMAYNMVQALDVYLYIGCTPAQIWWSLIIYFSWS